MHKPSCIHIYEYKNAYTCGNIEVCILMHKHNVLQMLPVVDDGLHLLKGNNSYHNVKCINDIDAIIQLD